jgi:light-regulated signal transduction histidine kinase (bacteriophytochrome)
VVAEAEEPGMEKYFGLRFPASDIPKQAREMYLKNPYRMIPDINATAVKIYPVINPVTNSFTDLSGSNIRNVVSVHIEYLKNMNVMSSISTRIIKDNKLWGLISCHHRTSKYPGFEIRSAFELMGEIISMQLAAKENEAKLEMKIKLNENKNQIVRRAAEQDLIKIMEDAPELLFGAIKSDGVAVVKENEISMAGSTPSVSQLNQLKDWLFRRNINEVFATDSLPLDFELGKDFKEVGSGLIVLPISKKRQEYILGFRPEVVQVVEWGGNPNDAIQMESDNKTYHPRNSFATWKETVKYFSSPWHEEEIMVAKSLSKEIIDLLES